MKPGVQGTKAKSWERGRLRSGKGDERFGKGYIVSMFKAKAPEMKHERWSPD